MGGWIDRLREAKKDILCGWTDEWMDQCVEGRKIDGEWTDG